MEGHGNFDTNFNYTFNSCNRLNLSDIIDSPNEDSHPVFLAENRQYSGNPVFPSMNIVGSQFQVGRQQLDYFGVSNFGSSDNSLLDQTRKVNQADARSNGILFTNERNSVLSTYAEKEKVIISGHKKRIDGVTNEEKGVDVPDGMSEEWSSGANRIKEEQTDNLEDFLDGKKREDKEVNVVVNDKSKITKTVGDLENYLLSNKGEGKEVADDETRKSDTWCKIDTVIKEEIVTDDENDVTGGPVEGKEDISEQSDGSTVIEDEDDITTKLLEGNINIVKKLQGKTNQSSSKKARKQKMPKLVLPKSKKEYKCETCGKVVLSQRALDKHSNLHTDKFKCKKCDKIFNSAESLENHKKVHSGYIGNEVCNVCDKTFYDKSSLKKHTLSVHMGITNYQCEYCHLSFFARKTYDEHVRVHTGEKPFKCTLCPKAYKRVADLNHHIRLHKGEVSHTCDKCGEGFRRVSELNRHMNSKHSDDDISRASIYPSKEKKCQWCGLGFSTLKALNAHVDTHKLVDDMVYRLGNKSDVAGEHGISVEKNIASMIPSISKSWTNISLPMMPMNFIQEMQINQVLDMSCKSMMLAEPEKQQKGIHDGNDSVESNQEEVTHSLKQKVSSSVLNETDLNMVFEHSNSSIENGEVHIPSTETDTDNEVDASVDAYREVNIGETPHIKSEIEDDFIGNDPENEMDDYEAETDTEDYNYVLDKKDNIGSGTSQEKVKDTVIIKIETGGSDIEGDEDIEDNSDEDPDFVPEVQKVSKRKATKPRKKTQKRRKSDDENEDESEMDPEFGIKVGKISKRKVTKPRQTNQKVKKRDDENEDNSEMDPDFEFKVEKVSKRKAAKPRKTNQKKKILKEMTDATDVNVLKADSGEKNANSAEEKASFEEDDTSASFKCFLCGKIFAKKVSLKAHMNIHQGTFACNRCGKCFATKYSLKVHIDNHEGRRLKTDQCNVCDKVFYDGSSLNKHIKTVHMDYRPFPCTVCDRRFAEHKTLSEHMRVHSGERPFACEICGKTYKRTSELNFHIRKHKGEVNLNCPECGKGFIRMGQLRQHILLKHDKERPFRCFICQKKFASRAMLKDHRKSHVIVKKHMCLKCGHKFSSKSKLNKHLRRKTDCEADNGCNINGMFSCKYCTQEFCKLEERKAHIQEEHKTSADRRHPCEICGKTFHRNQALKIHLKIHYQVRDYKCTECSAAFIQRHHLKQHIATHTGSRPYQCNVCLKSFAHGATLYNHMKHH